MVNLGVACTKTWMRRITTESLCREQVGRRSNSPHFGVIDMLLEVGVVG